MKIDYHTLLGYAENLCKQQHIHDWEDIAHDAWIDCQRRARRSLAVETTNEEALSKRIMYLAIKDAIRRHKRWVRVDPFFCESDQGANAMRTYFAADNWENPFWLRLTNITRKEIERDVRRKRIPKLVSRAVNVMLKDSRLPIVRQELKVSRPTFGTILRILKSRFALCYQALQAYRDFLNTLRF